MSETDSKVTNISRSTLDVKALEIVGVLVPIDADASDYFTLTLTKNVTLLKPINARVGRRFCIRFRQDGTGGWTVSFATGFRFPSGTPFSVTAAANAIDMQAFFYDEVDLVWDGVGNPKALS